MKKTYLNSLKAVAVVFAALFCFCSCGQIGDAASQIASAVVSSAGAEISSAMSEGMAEFSEGMNDFSEGMNELSEGISSVSEGISSAGSVVSERIDNIKENIGSEISEGLENAKSEISDKIGSAAENISNELSDAAEKIAPATSASSDETTTEPAPEKKQYTFRSQRRYDEHYEKHGKEFGDITKEEYLEMANELINSDSDRVLHKYSDDGDYMYFDQDTNYFLVLSADGYIRTFFIPTAGIKYWERQ